MGNLIFRDLRADEIDCRVAMISEKGLSLLLYKDARCDMIILDETVGAYNWQRTHSRDNANCIVSIYDSDKQAWISKEDTGTESNTEAAKGLASDSFKRACFNWGIGRELYTAPFIWISASDCKLSKRNDGKYVCYDKFSVKDISIKDKKIVGLTIMNESTKKDVYTFGAKATRKKADPKQEQPQTDHRTELRNFLIKNKIDPNLVVKACGLNNDSTDDDYAMALIYVKNMAGGQQT